MPRASQLQPGSAAAGSGSDKMRVTNWFSGLMDKRKQSLGAESGAPDQVARRQAHAELPAAVVPDSEQRASAHLPAEFSSFS